MNIRTNVEIRNGTVRNFPGSGIREYSITGTGHRIINVRVKDNAVHGICLSGQSHLVEKCTAVSNGAGIYAGIGSTITGNICYDNGSDGIYASYGSTVSGNTCYDNGDEGIDAGAGPGSTITGNTCYGNSDNGISANNGCTVSGNNCCTNSGWGIYLGENNFVDQNTATGNTFGNIDGCGTCTFGLNHAP